MAPVQNDYDRIRKMDIDSINRAGLLPEIHFDFDRAEIRDADKSILAQNADSLKKYDFLRVTVEGHCDERGTIEYNIALGERRAQSVIDYLASLGVPKERLKNVSYGKEVPVCSESNEACWRQNRRAKPTVTSKIK